MSGLRGKGLQADGTEYQQLTSQYFVCMEYGVLLRTTYN
jgi:hypothetical protein